MEAEKRKIRSYIRYLLVVVSLLIIISASIVGGALADRIFGIKPLDHLVGGEQGVSRGILEQRVLREESVVIDVVEEVGPSVVTVSVQTPARRILEFDPFSGLRSRVEGGVDQDIGTGFIISEDGLVITNKHVVSDRTAIYKVITSDNQEYEVQEISRDPSNDLAILKINASALKPVELGSSEDLKVGQFVIAIGTALGKFRSTVTTGVISGLGRGITAGSVFQGYVERLDDVIQTDAAINPGNSGGPLLNSAGQVIGVNVAVAVSAENIGFAIPIDIVKTAIDNFKQTGSFASKPFLGIEYSMIPEESAILNSVPQGAYVASVVAGSPAESAGIRRGDIITKLDGEELKNAQGGLAEVISKKKAGQRVDIEIWRHRPGTPGQEGDGETLTVSATLSEFTD
jgi:serine protease Do